LVLFFVVTSAVTLNGAILFSTETLVIPVSLACALTSLGLLFGVAINRVPVLGAGGPGKIALEAREEVEEGPGANDHVVNVDQEADEEHTIANTFKGRSHAAVDFVGAHAGVLTQGHFDKETWHANYEEHDHVRNEKGASAILIGHVGESPYIA